MFCDKCDAENSNGVNYCQKCGAQFSFSLVDAIKQKELEERRTAVDDVSNSTQPPHKTIADKPKKAANVLYDPIWIIMAGILMFSLFSTPFKAGLVKGYCDHNISVLAESSIAAIQEVINMVRVIFAVEIGVTVGVILLHRKKNYGWASVIGFFNATVVLVFMPGMLVGANTLRVADIEATGSYKFILVLAVIACVASLLKMICYDIKSRKKKYK